MTVTNYPNISNTGKEEFQIAEIANPVIDDVAKIKANGEIANSGVQFDEIELNTNKVSSFQETPDDTKFPTEKLTKDSLDLKVNISDIKDNLTSTDTDKPLSANQGKQLQDNKVNISDIKNNLTSTDENKPLSANQGKILNDTKANKVASPTDGNLIKTDSSGNPVDTGIPASNIHKTRIIWAYQDFSAGSITGTSVNLNAISGYSDLTFSASNIINSAFIVRSDSLEEYAYTGTTALFSSKIKVNSISGSTVTLSGIPHSSYPIRINYLYSSPFYPTNYTPPPKILAASALDKLDPIIVTQEEFENATSTNTNGANQLVKLNASGQLPSISGALLTNLPTTALPPGSIIPYVGSLTSIPSGFLYCNNSSVSRTTYAGLFSVIGTYYGSDSNSTFKLPELRGEVLRGADNGSGRDPDASSRKKLDGSTDTDTSKAGTYQSDEFRSHNHYYDRYYNRVEYASNAFNTNESTGDETNQYSWVPTGATGGNETRMRNMSVHWLIKY